MTTKEGRIANRKPVCNICGAKHWPREPHMVGGPNRATTGPNRATTGTIRAKAVQIAPAAGAKDGRFFDSPGKAWCAGWRCRCGHEWLTKGERPTRCPKCKARTWDRGET